MQAHTQLSDPPKRAGTAGIWVGIVLIVLGVLAGIGLVVAGARSVVTGIGELERVPAEGGGTIRLDGSGPVEVYAERDVAASAPTSFSSSTSGGPVPDVRVAVTGPGGSTVAVRAVAGSEEYQSDGHWGTRLGRFDAEAGTYTVEVVGGADASRYDTIAVGDSVEPRGLWLIVGGVLGGGLLVLVGIVVVIVSAIRRGRARKRADQGAVPYPPPGSVLPPPNWPPAPPAT